MNNELIKYAKILNKHDSKNLSQKLAKTVEEVGELASVILPFEDASGTIHRFVERNQILEEVIDVILCAQSIAHELEFTDDEIEAMFKQKLEKWGGLQAAEGKVADKPIPYEIHVTVNTSQIVHFKKACKHIGVKPIILDLQLQSGTMEDVMTSSVHFGSNRSAYEEVTWIADALENEGFDVVRKKIETVPWHPAAPQKTRYDEMPPDCYFESHLAVVVNNEKERRVLNDVAEMFEAHLSRNQFKSLDNGSYVLMITYRSYFHGYDMFSEKLQELKTELERKGFDVDKEIIEFSIYDTKVNHDAEWINS